MGQYQSTDAQQFIYHFGAIDEMFTAIQNFSRQMDTKLNEVDGTFKALGPDWTGTAHDAFAGCSAKWHSEATTISSTLLSLATAIQRAGEDFNAADQRNAGNFG
jgi:WXG100 family type VII secretion target